MKKLILLSSILLSIIPALACGGQPDSDPVVILYHDGTSGINLDDTSTQPKPDRITYHMLNVVLPQKYGINIKLKPIMWARGLKLLEAGLTDGITDASYNDRRANYAVYPMKAGKPDPAKMLRLVEYSLYKNKNSSILWDGIKFDGIDGDIVSISSYSIVADLRKMGIAVQEEPNMPWIMRNLALGKSQAAAMLSYRADEFLADNPAFKKNIIKVEKPLKRKEYYVIFSRKFYNERNELANAIWNAIEEYSASDEYHEMKNKFEK